MPRAAPAVTGDVQHSIRTRVFDLETAMVETLDESVSRMSWQLRHLRPSWIFSNGLLR